MEEKDGCPEPSKNGSPEPAEPSQKKDGCPELAESSKKKDRVFDFKKYNRRQIALRIAYLGDSYQGFAVQEPPAITVESCLLDTLKKTRLMEEKVNYSRCGRTDKGVSALGQVVSFRARSNLLEGEGVIVPEGSLAHTRNGNKTKELPYMVMLNRNLPQDIRVTGWATVNPGFSARFDCQGRTYKYFFPLGKMDLEKMDRAAKAFIGEHDFRNFCKMDIRGGTTNFVRVILRFDINVIEESQQSPYKMCVATVTGQAFLMHQVRCMMAILFLIGHGLEEESIISHMLDIQRCPAKPQYGMAPPEPLVLYDCHFEGLEWQQDQGEGKKVVIQFQEMWTQLAVKLAMVQTMLNSLSSSLTPSDAPSLHMAPLLACDHKLGLGYKSILKRPFSDAFEKRYEQHLAKKQKKDE